MSVRFNFAPCSRCLQLAVATELCSWLALAARGLLLLPLAAAAQRLPAACLPAVLWSECLSDPVKRGQQPAPFATAEAGLGRTSGGSKQLRSPLRQLPVLWSECLSEPVKRGRPPPSRSDCLSEQVE